MRLELKTGPAVAAITLADVKLYSFKNTTSYDDKITSLLVSETNIIERYTGRRLIDQSWYIYMDAVEFWDRLLAYNNTITLSTLNVSAITEVTYYDQSNATTVETASNYRLSGNQLAAASRLAFNDTFTPISGNLRRVDSVRIEVVAGYGAAQTNIPLPIVQALSVQIDQKVRFGNKLTSDTPEPLNENYQNLLISYKSVENYV